MQRAPTWAVWVIGLLMSIIGTVLLHDRQRLERQVEWNSEQVIKLREDIASLQAEKETMTHYQQFSR